MIRIFSSFCLAAAVSSNAAAQCSPTWLPGSGRVGPPYSDLFAVHDAGNGPTLWAANTWRDGLEEPLWYWERDHWQAAEIPVVTNIYQMKSLRVDGHPALMVTGIGSVGQEYRDVTAVYRDGEWNVFETPGTGWTLTQSGQEVVGIRPLGEYWGPSALHRWTGTEWEAISDSMGGGDQLIETPLGLITTDRDSSVDPPEMRVICLPPGRTEWSVLGVMPYDPWTYNDWTRLCWYHDRLIVTGFFDNFAGAAGPVVAYTAGGWESMGFDGGGQVSGVWVIDDQLVVGHGRYSSNTPTLLTFTDQGWIPYLRGTQGDFNNFEQHGSGWVSNLFAVHDGERNELIAVGSFDRAAESPALNAAHLDRNNPSAAWTAYGTGTAGYVTALARTDQGIVALGAFTQLEDTAVSLGAIQRSGTSQWESLVHSIRYDGFQLLPAWVNPITFQGKLVVAGGFISINGTDANYIATIDGTTTMPLGLGVRRTPSNFANNEAPITALTVFRENLIACWTFSEAGGLATGPLAAWDGSAWAPIGNVTHTGDWPPQIRAITVFEGDLVIAGDFDNVDGVAVQNVARFDGHSWSPMGAINISGYIVPVSNGSQLLEYRNKLLLSTGFAYSSNAYPLIREWDGENWIPFPIQLQGIESPSVSHMAIVNGELLVAGRGAAGQSSLARLWNGYEWRDFPATDGAIRDSAMDGDTLMVCGYFSNTSNGASHSLARIRCLCAADFNGDSTLDFNDYLDFVTAFAASNAAADFNTDGILDLYDYLDFVESFAAGC